MPTVFIILFGALTAAIVIGRRAPLRIPSQLVILLWIICIAVLAGRLKRMYEAELLALAIFGSIVWGITVCASCIARLFRSHGKSWEDRLRIHTGSLALIASYFLIAGPGGVVAIQAHLTIAPDVIDPDGCVRQTTPVTCAPASLASALNALGISATEKAVGRACLTSFLGTSVPRFAHAAEEFGCSVLERSTPLQDARVGSDFPALASVLLPGLGVPHFVCLQKMEGSRIYVADPATGGKWMEAEVLNDARWGDWYSIRRIR